MTSSQQLQRTDIRVNSICPGLVETGMTAAVFEYARQRGTANKIGQLNPLGRHAVAEGRRLLFCNNKTLFHYNRNCKYGCFLGFR